MVDEGERFRLIERPRFTVVDVATLPDTLGDPATLDVSVHLLYEGFKTDVERFLVGLSDADAVEVVITDPASGDGEWLGSLAGDRGRIVHLDRDPGWAEARNRVAATSRGAVIVFADLSVEPRGDILTPLVQALADPSVGIAGGWGLGTHDLRTFHEGPAGDVAAVEGYLLALRRETFAKARFDPWFRWYRHADLDLSFRIRAMGMRAVAVNVPAERREHRGWAALAEPERTARSRRNFNRFLDHWRDRPDLIR